MSEYTDWNVELCRNYDAYLANIETEISEYPKIFWRFVVKLNSLAMMEPQEIGDRMEDGAFAKKFLGCLSLSIFFFCVFNNDHSAHLF